MYRNLKFLHMTDFFSTDTARESVTNIRYAQSYGLTLDMMVDYLYLAWVFSRTTVTSHDGIIIPWLTRQNACYRTVVGEWFLLEDCASPYHSAIHFISAALLSLKLWNYSVTFFLKLQVTCVTCSLTDLSRCPVWPPPQSRLLPKNLSCNKVLPRWRIFVLYQFTKWQASSFSVHIPDRCCITCEREFTATSSPEFLRAPTRYFCAAINDAKNIHISVQPRCHYPPPSLSSFCFLDWQNTSPAILKRKCDISLTSQ